MARFEDQGSGFWVLGFGFKVPGSGFKVPGSGFKVLGSGFGVPGSRFRGSGFSAAAGRERPVKSKKKLPLMNSAIIDCGRGFQPRFTLDRTNTF